MKMRILSIDFKGRPKIQRKNSLELTSRTDRRFRGKTPIRNEDENLEN
jgi:hypothetical protein